MTTIKTKFTVNAKEAKGVFKYSDANLCLSKLCHPYVLDKKPTICTLGDPIFGTMLGLA